MSRILRKQDFIEMCWGAVLRSDGGDYPLEVALAEIERIDAEEPIAIEMITVDEMDEDLCAVIVGKLGPISTDAASCHSGPDGVLALKKMMEIMEPKGRKIGYLAHLEHDCIQIPYFLKVARACGLPLVDADACGRSVPTLGNILPMVYGLPVSPCVYASKFGETVVIETPDPCDCGTMELIGRNIVVGYNNMLISYALPPMTKAECLQTLALGSPSSLQETGKALIAARAAGADPAEAVLKVFEGKFICRGTVVEKVMECRDGFDFGRTLIRTAEGEEYTLLVQNEVLACRNGAGQLIVTAPDSIGMICMERGEGITNDEICEGMELEIVGIKAAEPWYRIPAGFDCWAEVFANVGLPGQKHVEF